MMKKTPQQRKEKQQQPSFIKPSQTVRLSKSFDKSSLRCEVHDIETKKQIVYVYLCYQ